MALVTDLAYMLPADNDIVNKTPLLGPWMHPCGLVLVGHPEEGVGDCKIVLCTHRQKKQPIAVHVPHTMGTQHSLTAFTFTSNSSIKVAEYDQLVTYQSFLHKGIKVLIECFLFFLTALEGRGIDADDSDMA